MILKPIIVIFAFLTLELASCTVHEQFVVRNRPKAPYADNQPPPPVGASVWIPAEWMWNGYQSTYTWHAGHWMRPRYGFIWDRGIWRQTPGGWYWIPGHWRRVR